MPHWELKPKGTQTWVECLNEWKDKVGADLQWKFSSTTGSVQSWRATPEIDNVRLTQYTGKGGSKDDAMNAAAQLLNSNHVLYRKK